MFGINCAPEIFQRIMEQILAGLLGWICFMDDILIHGETKEQHDRNLAAALARLAEYDILLNKEKCIFGTTSTVFLGHRLSEKGIEPTENKIEAIQSFRQPNSAEEVRSFLGLVNFTAKFIPNVATVTEPLRRLTKSAVPFEWGQEQADAFEQLKDAMMKPTILGYYDPKDRTQVIADASPVGLGAVLVQYEAKGQARIISFAHKSLTETEKRYAQTEKEAYALVWAVERFHHYLFGRCFELVTDHKPLEVIFGPKSKPCARIERWVLRLQSYKYSVKYQAGKSNIADPLSRLSCADNNTNSLSGEASEQYVNWIITTAEPRAIKIREIQEESRKDASFQAVKDGIYHNKWNELAAPFKAFELEICFQGDIMLRGTRMYMPVSLQTRAMELAHEGHPGMSQMKRRLRAKSWWPKMDQQIEQFVKQCAGCTLVSAPPPPEPMKRTELPSQPWQHLAMDFLGPLPSGHYIFVLVDYFSRYFEIEIMTKIDSKATIDRLKFIFARFGLPYSVTADNGRQFVSLEMREYFEKNNIRLISTTPFWPQMNGEVERQNSSLLKRLIISQQMKGDWREDLHQYLLMYRSTPHSTTLRTPAELMFSRNIRDKLPSIQQPMEIDHELADRDKQKKHEGKEYGDAKRRAKKSEVQVGDLVVAKRQIMSNKLVTRYEPTAYEVIKRNGPEAVIKSTESSATFRRNMAHLKRIPSSTLPIPADQPPTASTSMSRAPSNRVRKAPSRYRPT